MDPTLKVEVLTITPSRRKMIPMTTKEGKVKTN